MLARLLNPKPVLPGEPVELGTVYRGADAGPLIVLAGDRGAPPDWLGSALATAIGGIAIVLADPREPADGAEHERTDAETEARRDSPIASRILTAVAACASLGADADRVAIVAVGDSAPAALRAAAGRPPARRLVILAPTAASDGDLTGVPPTFLQSSPQSPSLPVSRSLEIDLREAGVAVRPVEYAALPDAWVRYPRFTPGSKRAVEDIAAFLRRGFGLDGTFSGVIPGWDLK